MPENPITVPLPQDMPTNWVYGQTIGPNGTDVGLAQQYGYNYLMQQVNAAQQAAEELGKGISGLSGDNIPETAGSETSISTALSNKAGVLGLLPLQANLDTVTALGFYYATDSMAPDIANSPITTGFHLYVLRPDKDGDDAQQRVLQILTSTGILDANAAVWYRKHTGNGWSVWRSFATATQPQEYDLPVSAGITAKTALKYWKDGSGNVGISGTFIFTSDPTSGQVIAVLPAGFRPEVGQNIALISENGTIGYGWVLANGNIQLVSSSVLTLKNGDTVAIVAPPYFAAN